MSRSSQPLANTFTIGVRDFEAQRSFYAALGWPLAFDSDDFAVFELRGALLALFPLDKLAADAHADPDPAHGGIRGNVIITVDSAEEVDELAERVRETGGRFTKAPVDAEFFVGRDAYFTDIASDVKKVVNLHGKSSTVNINGVHFSNFTVQGNPVTSRTDPVSLTS